jgi:hypothetical protein
MLRQNLQYTLISTHETLPFVGDECGKPIMNGTEMENGAKYLTLFYYGFVACADHVAART